MNKEIEKSLTTIFIMIAPALMDFGKIGLLNNLRALSPIPLQPQNKPEYGVEVFKSDFSSTLKQLNAVFTYYRENTRSINSASADLHLRDVTNFILGLGILRYQLVAYMYKSGITQTTFISAKTFGLIRHIDKILNEYSVFSRVVTLINRYHKPKLMRITNDADKVTVLTCDSGKFIGKYNPPEQTTANDPRTRDHYNCNIFPILTYVREIDLMLSTYSDYRYLSIKFHKQPKDILKRANKIKGHISDMYSLISSEVNVKAIKTLAEYCPEVDISELDIIIKNGVVQKLHAVK